MATPPPNPLRPSPLAPSQNPRGVDNLRPVEALLYSTTPPLLRLPGSMRYPWMSPLILGTKRRPWPSVITASHQGLSPPWRLPPRRPWGHPPPAPRSVPRATPRSRVPHYCYLLPQVPFLLLLSHLHLVLCCGLLLLSHVHLVLCCDMPACEVDLLRS
jgi:hypothetical protein